MVMTTYHGHLTDCLHSSPGAESVSRACDVVARILCLTEHPCVVWEALAHEAKLTSIGHGHTAGSIKASDIITSEQVHQVGITVCVCVSYVLSRIQCMLHPPAVITIVTRLTLAVSPIAAPTTRTSPRTVVALHDQRSM